MSEVDPGIDLQLSRRVRLRRHLSKVRGFDIRSKAAELNCVEDVERIDREHQLDALRNRKLTAHCQIYTPDRRSPKAVWQSASHIPESVSRWCQECIFVDVRCRR